MSSRFLPLPALLLAVSTPASAIVVTDSGDSGGNFYTTTSNLAVYSGKFEVQYDENAYDGDGATFEDEKATGTVTYDVTKPEFGRPPVN